jgi:MFS family permease
MATLSGFRAIGRALQSRNYAIFVTASNVSHIGTWANRVAVGWLTWQLTHSGLWLGLMSFADLFPTVVFAPLTGAVADRVDRLRLMKICQVLCVVQGLLLCGLTYAGQITIELLFALTFGLGTVVSFNQPARLAIIPNLVNRRDLATAIGLNSVVFNLARFVGPAISGVLIVELGSGAAFGFMAATYFVFMIALYFLRLPPEHDDSLRLSRHGIVTDIVGGYAYATRHAGIGPMLLMLTVTALAGRPYGELLPGFADAVFGRGAHGLAWLTSAIGAGAAIGGLWLAQRETITGLTRVSIHSVLLLAIALLVFGATHWFWVGLAAVFVSGFAMVVMGVGQQTLIQTAVDASMRGRVLGLYGMVQRGGPALGALAMGALSERFGLQTPVIGGAIVCALMWLWAERRKTAVAHALEVEPGEPKPGVEPPAAPG